MSRRRDTGFTIVEMLMVIGTLALLLGLLLPALSGAQRRGLKTRELNALRQVGLAWSLYSNSSNDHTLPGFLEPEVQASWKVTYDFPDKTTIPPAPSFSGGEPNLAGPWTWRLMPMLDYNHAMVHGYADEPEYDATTFFLELAEAEATAYRPGFGYNAFYVGGWWEMSDLGGGQIPRYRYFDAESVDGRNLNVVVKSISTIRRSSELVVFCSSSRLTTGIYREFRNNLPGWHYASPPLLAGDETWKTLGGDLVDPGSIGGGGGGGGGGDPRESASLSSGDYDPTVVVVPGAEAAAPIGRYNRLVAILNADGHTESETPGALMDMRRWIDQADAVNWTHE